MGNGGFSGESEAWRIFSGKYRMDLWNTEFGNLGNLGNGGFSGESEEWGIRRVGIFWGIQGMGNSESEDFYIN